MLKRKTRGLSAVRDLMRRSYPTRFTGVGSVFENGDQFLALFDEKPTERNAVNYLNYAASTGSFTGDDLGRYLELLRLSDHGQNRRLIYTLASLLLQCDYRDQVAELLDVAGTTSDEMNWFAALMLFAREQGLDIPIRQSADIDTLDYVERLQSDPFSLLTRSIESCTHLHVVGNAPGAVFAAEQFASQLVYFNDYKKNSQLCGEPLFHVVTPSWDFSAAHGGQHLLITGNNIFHRRSQVWRKFKHCPDYQSISCFPRDLWCRLYRELKAPPSAGLLMICYLSELTSDGDVTVSIAGFSEGRPEVNHDYDRVPPSPRHNWGGELVIRERALQHMSATSDRRSA